ncbi:MAG TPA: leucyl aminopeptidase family protein [Steroidobacteraceae bacterium]|nr:leucyl aminopeptidase family protein [Steroidobacteraceae bacterium]
MAAAFPLPALPRPPELARRARLGERAAADVDAILAIASSEAPAEVFAELPQSERWRELRKRAGAAAGVASGALGNARSTRTVLGALGARASTFEALALAGRMLKELGPRAPASLALAAPGGAGAHPHAHDALLSGALAHAFELATFRKPSGARAGIRRIELVGAAPRELAYLETAARGTNLARFLTALPPNVLDARAYRRFITRLARERGLGFRWLDERSLKRLGANAFLAVSAGNAERTAGIAHLAYRPARRRRAAPDLALIGKGILFDTGGTNLKPHRAMLEMHTDMAGSAVALATLDALARLEAPLAVDAWLAITENRIGPRSYIPQEVVRAANGVTIQVIHTDAEGRMVLADTLALAARSRPRLMIDFATLTGACLHALTERMSGVFTNEPQLSDSLLAAGRASGERVWGFPFDADYDSDLESKVADTLQCAVDGKGDHILAARFLSRFVPASSPWVHLDLSSAVRAGGLGHIGTDVTGFGVRYALELIVHQRVLEQLGARR